MKKYFLLAFALFMSLFANAQTPDDEPLKIRWCTFNIRLITQVDYKIGCGWDQRKERVSQYL